MNNHTIKIGSTNIAKITKQADMNEFVKTLGLSSDTLVIKPNWVQARQGTYTDAKVLDLFLTAVDKPAIFVESYTFWRTDKYAIGGGDYFSSKESFLDTGKKHWDHFKKQDQWFLEASGIKDFLEKHQAKYLNITNEVWEGKVADREKIKKLVEEKYEPVYFKELYSFIPQELYQLIGADFISFSKAKKEKEYAVTLSTKNLFGLIPAPRRYPKYHGEDDKLLARSIADINKIYRSIFNCTFIVDGVFTASFAQSMEEVACVKDWGVIFGGKNSIEVDKIAEKLLGADISTATVDTLKLSRGIFGDVDNQILSKIPSKLVIKY